MDKQIGEVNEIVEEIEQFLARKILGGKAWNTRDIAEGVYELITENAVVLTREEYEKLQALKDDYVKGYEAGVDEGWDNARKETAEKFAKRLKAKLSEWLDDNEDLNFKIDKGIAIIELIGVETLEGEVIAEGLIDEICKGIIGGKV